VSVVRLPTMNSLPQTYRWYALHVRSRHEKSVRAQLEAKEYSVFLPLYPARNRWGDRWKTVDLPLFPGYVFCHFDSVDRSPVVATSGVIDIVRIGSDPAPIGSHEIDAIKLVADSHLPVEPYPSLAVGQRVVMQSGPLSGITGTLIEVRNNFRLVVSVQLLQRSVLVQIDQRWAAPLAARKAAV